MSENGFHITKDVIGDIMVTTTFHLRGLNEDLVEEYGDNADAAFCVAMGCGLATTLASFSDPEIRANIVEILNKTLEELEQPYKLISAAA